MRVIIYIYIYIMSVFRILFILNYCHEHEIIYTISAKEGVPGLPCGVLYCAAILSSRSGYDTSARGVVNAKVNKSSARVVCSTRSTEVWNV